MYTGPSISGKLGAFVIRCVNGDWWSQDCPKINENKLQARLCSKKENLTYSYLDRIKMNGDECRRSRLSLKEKRGLLYTLMLDLEVDIFITQ